MGLGLRRWEAELTPWQRGLTATLFFASVWTLLYYLFILAPVGWTIERAKTTGLVGSLLIGLLSRGLSRRFLPLGIGAAIGIAFGGAEAYVIDVITSTWTRCLLSLEAFWPYPLELWLSTSVGWATADLLAKRRWTPWRG